MAYDPAKNPQTQWGGGASSGASYNTGSFTDPRNDPYGVGVGKSAGSGGAGVVSQKQPASGSGGSGGGQNPWGAPLPGETAWQQHGGEYWNPTNSQGHYQDAQARYAGGTPTVSDNLGGYYAGFNARRPELSANLDPYYNNAERRGEEKIRAVMGAKGMYGSSGADDQIREMYTNFEGDKAKAEAQYGLDRSNAMLGWENAGANEAHGVDTLSAARSANELSWLQGLGGLATNADNAQLSYLNSGMNAAMGAGNQQLGREGQAWNQQMGLGNAVSGQYSDYINALYGSDAGWVDDTSNIGIAQGGNAANEDYRRQDQFKDLLKTGMSVAGMAKGG